MPQWAAAALFANATAATSIANNSARSQQCYPSGCQMLCITGVNRESSLLLDDGDAARRAFLLEKYSILASCSSTSVSAFAVRGHEAAWEAQPEDGSVCVQNAMQHWSSASDMVVLMISEGESAKKWRPNVSLERPLILHLN